jgi:pSer/pThr/pTyr-binding forkhead associated (FHA) protein
MPDSLEVDELLLILKVAFLVLLYLFIWRIVRSAAKDIRPTQESMLLRPDQVPPELRSATNRRAARLVVLKSPSLIEGADFTINSAPVTIGRGGQNDLVLSGDGFASAEHARVEQRADGAWVEDHGSTNGTFVNGEKVEGRRRLARGDVVRIGETDLRFEA